MRLWSIHPRYLDRIGLLALWRESLLAQKVLQGKTRGYIHHPQVLRFRDGKLPHKAIGNYLEEIWKEAQRRGYAFDHRKIGKRSKIRKMPMTQGQLRYEFDLLLDKLRKRDPFRYHEFLSVRKIRCHPFFRVVEGSIERWEKIKSKEKI